MMPRPPLTLWRYLTGDLWRLLFLTTGVVLSVTAFASGVQPLARGLLAPETALKYMALSIPPMLQFALPFAAGFAATLAYHRFASDNEALAASAGGVSHRSLLLPAAATGAVLALVLAVLTQQVIPRFFRSMEQTLRRDVASILISRLEGGQSAALGDRLVYAGEALRLGPDAASEAFERLVLSDVLVLDMTREGEIRGEAWASRAEVWLRHATVEGEEATVLAMRLLNPVMRGAGTAAGSMRSSEIGPVVFRHSLHNSPKFMTAPELVAMSKGPDANPDVERRRRRLVGEIASSRLGPLVRDTVEQRGVLQLVDPDGVELRIRARAAEPAERGWRLKGIPTAAGERLELQWTRAGAVIRRQTAEAAELSWELGPEGMAILVELERVVGVGEAAGGRASLRYANLRIDEDPAMPLLGRTSDDLLGAARDGAFGVEGESATGIAEAAGDLRKNVTKLRRDILGNQHERWAFSVACLVMTLTGAVMALRLREGMPLTVYLWSFFPSLVALMTIAGGENTVRSNPVLGLALLWAGVAGLALYTLVVYFDLRRH